MTKASDNAFPSVLITEGTVPSSPAAGKQRIYVDSTTHVLKIVNSSGTASNVGSGSVATDAIWDAAGDMVIGTGADTAAKVAIGTSGYVWTSNGTTATWAAAAGGTVKRFRLTKSTTQSTSNGTGVAVTWDTETYDSGNVHFTSSANLTGTVTKTASSADLVGSGTLFTSELTVGQVISVPGTAAEVRVVTVITDNTHLTCGRIFANSASGQTVARKNEYIGFTAAENWTFSGTVEWAAASGGERAAFLELTKASDGSAAYVATGRVAPANTESCVAFAGDYTVAAGDIIRIDVFQTQGTLNVSSTRTVWTGHTF